MEQTNKFILYVWCFSILALMFPVIQEITVLTHITPMLLLATVLTLLVARRYVDNKSLACFLAYSIVIFIYYWLGSSYYDDFTGVWTQELGLLISLGAVGYAYNTNNESISRQLIITFCLLLAYTAVASFVIDRMYPGLLRVAETEDEALIHNFYSFGFSDYVLPHLTPMLIPAFIMGWKNKELSKKQRYMALIMAFMCFLLVVVSQSATAFLLSIVVILLSFLIKNDTLSKNAKLLIIISVLSIPFIVSKDVQLSVVNFIDSLVGFDGNVHLKMQEFESQILYGDSGGSDLNSRKNLYKDSIDAFISSPIWGSINAKLGGHAALLDIMGACGLLAITPLLFLIYYQIKLNISRMSIFAISYYLIGIFAMVIMISVKNMIRGTTWLMAFFFLPLLINYYSQKDCK